MAKQEQYRYYDKPVPRRVHIVTGKIELWNGKNYEKVKKID